MKPHVWTKIQLPKSAVLDWSYSCYSRNRTAVSKTALGRVGIPQDCDEAAAKKIHKA